MSKLPLALLSHPVLLDGAWGTELQALGLGPRACPDLWNVDRPERVEAIARAYVEAGSEVILTNTFGANRVALSRHGLESRAREINRAGARASRSGAAGCARVFASMGPSGKILAMRQISEAELRTAFEEQAQALAEEHVDGLALETFGDLDELRIALQAAQATGLPAVACLVFDSGPARDRTMMGTTPEQAAKVLSDAGADAIGANCGNGIEGFVPICRRLRAAIDLPLWLKPNAGLPVFAEGRITYGISPEQFAKGAVDLLDAGASFVGGCCGTSPTFIRAMAAAFASRAAGPDE
jgi:5-methyltetrahydrofolate--homocysteine methyltransferase